MLGGRKQRQIFRTSAVHAAFRHAAELRESFLLEWLLPSIRDATGVFRFSAGCASDDRVVDQKAEED